MIVLKGDKAYEVTPAAWRRFLGDTLKGHAKELAKYGRPVEFVDVTRWRAPDYARRVTAEVMSKIKFPLTKVKRRLADRDRWGR